MKEEKIRIFNDSLLITLALLSVGLLLVELTTDLTNETLVMFRIIDIGVALIFGLEFLIRLYESSARKDFMKQNWWQILASIPVTGTGTQALRGLMIIRLFRIARIMSVFARLSILFRSLKRVVKETHMVIVASLMGIVLFGGSLVFYQVEHVVNPAVNTVYDGLWFMTETMTNTGVGDVYPMTSGGRAVGILSMFFGAIIFGLFVAFIASYLVRTKKK